VFAPLEMEGTSYCTEGPPIRAGADAIIEVGPEHSEAGAALEVFSASKLCSTAPDLARLMRGLADRTLIDESSWRLLAGPVELALGVESPYGMGLVQRPLEDNEALAISGGYSGGAVQVAWYPAFDLVIATAASGEESAVDLVQRRIARTFFEIPEPGVQDLELPPEERKGFLEDIGQTESGLDRLAHAGHSLLHLIAFFTTGPKESRAWSVFEGARAPQAAGKIHSDFERGFIRAETVAYEELVQRGGWNACKEAGILRSEGKEYVVKDGDVMLFRFNV